MKQKQLTQHQRDFVDDYLGRKANRAIKTLYRDEQSHPDGLKYTIALLDAAVVLAAGKIESSVIDLIIEHSATACRERLKRLSKPDPRGRRSNPWWHSNRDDYLLAYANKHGSSPIEALRTFKDEFSGELDELRLGGKSIADIKNLPLSDTLKVAEIKRFSKKIDTAIVNRLNYLRKRQAIEQEGW